ncbi:MAG TPA: ABC transporter substrate-binding protein [Gaiellaceae bacterium]|nr:ABC transporter substrate-binding protein [Gaiellaceae bacterium]
MSEPAGERRIVTVLMADIAGSTAIGEQLGPERSKFLFDEVVRLIAEEVRRFGGTVAQLTGDGLFALFGAPQAHEDDSERAVRAALAAQETLGDYAGQVEEAYGVGLGARFGINTGPVVLIESEAPSDERYNALGDTVNVASRLQTLSGDGGITVGPATARQIENRFELQSLGAVELKGKSAPLEAFLVAGERALGTEARAATPFVGRAEELATLESVVADLTTGRGAVVSVTGEPGIGKSRLVAETRAAFAGDVTFLEGQGAAYAESFAYWPVRELLRDWLGLGISDPEARARLELKAALARLNGRTEGAYPFLATLLGVALEPDLAQQLNELSRDSVQRQTVEAVRGLLSELADERPLCLVLEDLHWADEATLELIEELLSLTEDEAVALVLLYRSEREHRAWLLGQLARQRYPHRYHELELRPLERDDALAIADAELPEQVAEILVDRAGGNPFFLEEALRDLVERGALRRENGRYELAVGLDELRVPTLVQEALQARLDRLTPDTKEVVGVASVIGRTFGMPLLEQVAPREQLRQSLSELQRLELVVEERRRPSPEYRFRHGLVQEAAYASLTESRRRSLHRSVGDALEQLAVEEAPEAYAVLGRHFAEGDEPERAADYLLKAGDVARGLDAEEEALGHYRRALDFLDRIGDERRARDTLLKIALTHHLAFDFEQADRAYGEAFSRHVPEPKSAEPSEALESGTLELDALAPGYSYWQATWDFLPNLFRGLLMYDRDLNVVPAMAHSFRLAPDGSSYRFEIRPDARWNDGTRVTAGDFAYAWHTMREEGVVTAHLLEPIEEAVALAPHTLEVRLREPRESLLYLLAIPPAYPWPRHKCEELGDDWRHPENLVGNGPFVLTGYLEGEYALEAGKGWPLPRGNVRQARFVCGTTDELSGPWSAGELDVLRITRRWPEAAVGSPQTVLETAAGLAVWFAGFVSDRAPFDDVRVRQAFSHATDRRALKGGGDFPGDPAERSGMIPPAMPAHSHRAGLEFDLGRARALLADAGFPEGRGFPEVVVGARILKAGERLIQQWRETLGIAGRAYDLPGGAYEGGDANVVLDGWIADVPDPGNYIEGVLAVPGAHVFRDSRVEDLLTRARSVYNRRARIRLYQEAEQIWITEQAAVLPLDYFRQYALRRPWVEGYWVNPCVNAPLDEIWVMPRERARS